MWCIFPPSTGLLHRHHLPYSCHLRRLHPIYPLALALAPTPIPRYSNHHRALKVCPPPPNTHKSSLLFLPQLPRSPDTLPFPAQERGWPVHSRATTPQSTNPSIQTIDNRAFGVSLLCTPTSWPRIWCSTLRLKTVFPIFPVKVCTTSHHHPSTTNLNRRCAGNVKSDQG